MSDQIAYGGKSVYGASVGILRLEAKYPRIIGDIGNALTWPFPVHYKTVKGANADLVVRQKSKGLIKAFQQSACELVELGADGIATTCGFLSLIQDEIADSCKVPVASSPLLQYSAIHNILPKNKKVGILTISYENLSREHLSAASIPADTPIVGTDEDGNEFSRVVLNSESKLDIVAAEQDMIQATKKLLKRDADVGAVLLECTSMDPYAETVRRVSGLPVFGMYNFICWFQSSLSPRNFLAKKNIR